MTARQIRKSLKDLGLSQIVFARLMGVTPRAVNLWATGKRHIPGPVIAYLRIFPQLSASRWAKEVMGAK